MSKSYSRISSSWASHLRTTGCHRSMVLTIFLLAARHKRAHLALIPAGDGWYSIYLPQRDGRLSWPSCLITRGPGIEPWPLGQKSDALTTAPPRHPSAANTNSRRTVRCRPSHYSHFWRTRRRRGEQQVAEWSPDVQFLLRTRRRTCHSWGRSRGAGSGTRVRRAGPDMSRRDDMALRDSRRRCRIHTGRRLFQTNRSSRMMKRSGRRLLGSDRVNCRSTREWTGSGLPSNPAHIRSEWPKLNDTTLYNKKA